MKPVGGQAGLPGAFSELGYQEPEKEYNLLEPVDRRHLHRHPATGWKNQADHGFLLAKKVWVLPKNWQVLTN